MVLPAVLLVGSVTTGGGEPASIPRTQTPDRIEVIADHPLPESLPWVTDVRWKDDQTVLISCPVGKVGVTEVDLSNPERFLYASEPEVRNGSGHGRFYVSQHLGYSPQFLALGSPVFVVGWKQPGQDEAINQYPVAGVVDLDVHDNRLLLLGMDRTEDGAICDEVAWVGSLDNGYQDRQAVAYATASTEVPAMARCFYLEQGAARFLKDGSFVVVPGAEPGVYHYSAEGRLIAAWQSEVFGLAVGCTPDQKEAERFGYDPDFRWGTVNQMRITDEILSLPSGPALVVRSAAPGGTSWELYLLEDTGTARASRLPISSPSRLSYLRGDVRGNQVVLLVSEYGRPDLHEAPDTRPRLILASIS
jgi:hypothetical protein